MENGATTWIDFFRLNIIDNYNRSMGHVDVSDQLRTVYRPDRWMRMQKWWMAIFLFLLGVALTNSYVLYCETCIREGKAPMSHRQFRQLIAQHLIAIDSSATTTRATARDNDTSRDTREQQAKDKKQKTTRGAMVLSRGGTTIEVASQRNCRLTKNTLESNPAFLKREQNVGDHIMSRTKKANGTRCQLCNMTVTNAHEEAMKQFKAGAISRKPKLKARPRINYAEIHCNKCGIELCIDCWSVWHKM